MPSPTIKPYEPPPPRSPTYPDLNPNVRPAPPPQLPPTPTVSEAIHAELPPAKPTTIPPQTPPTPFRIASISLRDRQPPRLSPYDPIVSPAQAPEGIPTPLTSKELPAKYKFAEKRIRLVIIALPIAIVTSYMLYKRLILGEERKVLVRPEERGTFR